MPPVCVSPLISINVSSAQSASSPRISLGYNAHRVGNNSQSAPVTPASKKKKREGAQFLFHVCEMIPVSSWETRDASYFSQLECSDVASWGPLSLLASTLWNFGPERVGSLIASLRGGTCPTWVIVQTNSNIAWEEVMDIIDVDTIVLFLILLPPIPGGKDEYDQDKMFTYLENLKDLEDADRAG